MDEQLRVAIRCQFAVLWVGIVLFTMGLAIHWADAI